MQDQPGLLHDLSPVDGTIIDRRVNIGQTVVASLSSPSLFLIAKDLTTVQVWVAVNEADVGDILQGQPVIFTVDAFPNQTFDGDVDKVRLNARMTSNVVTYTVEVTTDNSAGKLLPYLTANAWFETGEEKTLMIPNAALRWTPTPVETGRSPAAPAPEPARAGSPTLPGPTRRRRRRRTGPTAASRPGLRYAPDARQSLGG